MKSKALIIGAGVGGLATAVRLLSKGYDVIIFEKEDRVGGKVNLKETNGFSFDLTASVLMTPEIYKDLFHYANRKWEDYLEFYKLDPFYQVFYCDGSKYNFYSDLAKLIPMLESISLRDSLGYLNYLADSYQKYLITNEFFLNKAFDNFSDFFNPSTLAKALKTKAFSTTCDYISKFIKDEKLRQFICFQALYIGISPFEGPNIYTLLPTISQLYGLWHLKGGMYSYIKTLEKMIEEFSGTIRTNEKVLEVLFKEERAVGVKTDKGIQLGDIIICNADFPYAIQELITKKDARGTYNDKKVENMKYSCSTFIIYLGLNKKYDTLSVHNLFINENFKQNIEDAFTGKLPESPSLYLYCPSRVDSEIAPYNKEALNVVVRVPNLHSNTIVWDEKTIKEFRDVVLNALITINGLEDIKNNIIYESYLTPKDLQSLFNSCYGSAFGLSHTLTQTNYFRPHIKSDCVDNLYFVGGSVHPGTGVSMILLSSKLVVEEILKYYKLNK